MKGWKVFPSDHEALWKVQDSVLVGGNGVLKIAENNYLYTTDNFEDFELRCLFRLSGDANTGLINSG
ncbi:MAG: family 16 glycoside hydrolase, partial [Cyclobacteriaceae bacterium]